MTIIASISKIGNIKSISSSSIVSGKSNGSFGGNKTACDGSNVGANIGANANVGFLGSSLGANANANVGLSGPITLLIDTSAQLDGGSCGCN